MYIACYNCDEYVMHVHHILYMYTPCCYLIHTDRACRVYCGVKKNNATSKYGPLFLQRF